MEHTEQAWPDLVNALDDQRYSVTFTIHDYPSNWSVGKVCGEIISDYLAQGCYFHPVYDDADGRRWETIMMNPVPRESLKQWCQERKNKTLYELQIETCEWAITTIAASFPLASADSQRQAIEAIRAEIKALETTKKPLRPECFYMAKGAMGEGGGPYRERRKTVSEAPVEVRATPGQQPQPSLRVAVRRTTPESQSAGETARFAIDISNPGVGALKNVKVVAQAGPNLSPIMATFGFTEEGAKLIWTIDALPAGRTEHLQLDCRCDNAADEARLGVSVTVPDGPNVDAQSSLRICPAPATVPSAN